MHLGFVSLVGAAAGAAAARRGAPSPSSTRVPLPTGVAAATTLWPGRRHPRLVPLSPAAAAAAAVAAAAAAATTTPAPLAGRTATRHDRRGGGVPATAPPPPSSRPSPTTCSLHPLSHRTVAWLAPVLPHRAQWRLHRGTRAQRLDRLLMAVVGGVLTLLLPAPFGRVGRLLGLAFFAALPMLAPAFAAAVANARFRAAGRYAALLRGRLRGATRVSTPATGDATELRIGDADGRALRLTVPGTAALAGGRADRRAPPGGGGGGGSAGIPLGTAVEVVVVAEDPDFDAIRGVSEVYVPEAHLFLGAYRYLRASRLRRLWGRGLGYD